MSSPDGLSRRGLLLAPLALAACGLEPALAPGGPSADLQGRVALETPDTPDGYRLRARLEDRLGRSEAPAATLAVTLATEAAEAITGEDGALRTHWRGRASWRLAAPAGATLAQGEESAFAAAATGGDLLPARAAEEDARARLAVLLADRIVARLLLLPDGSLP